MTAETENLVLELLRGKRADMGAFRSDRERRLMAVETQLEGWRSVSVATTGTLVSDLKSRETHTAALEGARV